MGFTGVDSSWSNARLGDRHATRYSGAMGETADMPSSRGGRTALFAGSAIGAIGVLCGGGGGLAAVAAVGWWYLTQPDGVVLDRESVTINGTSPASLPVAGVHRRLGDTVPAWMPLDWRVEPPALAAIEGDRLVPREPGSGEVRACFGQLCDSAALTVAMVDSISTTPTKSVGFRLWTPRAIEAAAQWKGEPVPVPILWSTADHAVATVSDKGVLTPVAPGSTELRIEAGGVVTTLTVTVHPEPPADCTLPKYADVLGRTGRRDEHKKCQSEAPDFCEWDSKQALVGGGTVIEGGGWEWGWATLELPGVDPGEAWNLARRCMELPPEVAAVDLPALLRERRAVTKVVPLAGDWDGEPQATIEVKGGKAQIALPSACYSDRTFSVDRAGVVTLGVSAGC